MSTEGQGSLLSAASDQPLHILLVEDSAADADLLVAMLEEELPGAQVAVSSTVAGAVPLLAGPLDIAITDLSLPDAQGLQALTAILSARPDIAVVVMTGRKDRALAMQALSAGAEDYLVKGNNDARGVATAVLYAAQRRAAETKARRYERLALSLLDAMEASTCAIEADGTIIAVNKAWNDFAAENGGDPARVGVGMNYFDVCRAAGGADADDAREVRSGLQQVLDGHLGRFEREYACHAPHEQRWLSVRVNALTESGAVLSHVDVSVTKRTEQALSHLSLHDPLTNLPNRELLLDRLEQALTLAARDEDCVAVAFLDVDAFKRINDSLGHPAGDALLGAVAERLQNSIRQGDTLARFAGDEFVVVWPGIDSPDEAKLLAERLHGALAAPIALEGGVEVAVTMSTGITVGRPPATPDELLLEADAAMYDAKSRGRGLTRMFTGELRKGAAASLRIEADLRAALERSEFVLHYQPVVDLRSRVVSGVEALVRWRHPDGLRMPDNFIGVAEASGLIVPLGAWVLDEACRQGAAWAAQGLDLQMAVNFSARQIGHPDALQAMERALRNSGLRPERLVAEVTESTVLQDAEVAQLVFARIRELGAAVAIDDFGTGYSSLLYLKRYPIAVLKIDRQFVSGMGTEDDDAIVASVINLAHAVGAVCIAEGVETREQFFALCALGCDYAQGYLFSRAVPASDLPRIIGETEAMLQGLPRAPERVASVVPPLATDLLLRIRELHQQGASLHTIAAALNREGHENPSGQRWTGPSVAKVVAGLAPTSG